MDYGYDGRGQLVKAIGKEINSTNRLQEQLGYAYDASGNLQYRTNHTLIQQFNVNGLNVNLRANQGIQDAKNNECWSSFSATNPSRWKESSPTSN